MVTTFLRLFVWCPAEKFAATDAKYDRTDIYPFDRLPIVKYIQIHLQFHLSTDDTEQHTAIFPFRQRNMFISHSYFVSFE